MKEIIKKRTIKVTGMTCEGCERTINTGLGSLDGVILVKANRQGTVYVEYDLMKIRLATIEKTITALGYTPANGFFSKIKSGWTHYTEENEYGNQHAVFHSCCSDTTAHKHQ